VALLCPCPRVFERGSGGREEDPAFGPVPGRGGGGPAVPDPYVLGGWAGKEVAFRRGTGEGHRLFLRRDGLTFPRQHLRLYLAARRRELF